MSARSDYHLMAAWANGFPVTGLAADAMEVEVVAALDEIARLRAKVVGLRVRTLTAEGDADRLAGTLAGIHQPRLSLHPRDCGCGTHLALEAHASAFARRVAGETGDTP